MKVYDNTISLRFIPNRSVFCLSFNREVSHHSGQQLMQESMTGLSAENKWWWHAQPQMGSCITPRRIGVILFGRMDTIKNARAEGGKTFSKKMSSGCAMGIALMNWRQVQLSEQEVGPINLSPPVGEYLMSSHPSRIHCHLLQQYSQLIYCLCSSK